MENQTTLIKQKATRDTQRAWSLKFESSNLFFFLSVGKDIPIIIPTVTDVNNPKTIFIPGAMVYGSWCHRNWVIFTLLGANRSKIKKHQQPAFIAPLYSSPSPVSSVLNYFIYFFFVLKFFLFDLACSFYLVFFIIFTHFLITL